MAPSGKMTPSNRGFEETNGQGRIAPVFCPSSDRPVPDAIVQMAIRRSSFEISSAE